MTFTKSVAGLVPGMMSLAVVGHTAKMIPQDWSPKGMKNYNSKKATGNLIKGFTGIMIAVPMIGATAGMVNKL